ncbi:MAG: hypothetical protein JWQ49_4293 [Edaphobacter sp.]|nr:hypothetical protein [Edaphobacter sp.]
MKERGTFSMVAFFDETAVAKDRLYVDMVKGPNR